MSKIRPRRGGSSPPRWTGLEVLASTRHLNARCFGLLAEVAKTEDAGIAPIGVFASQELWAQVDPQVCERAGSCPVLLLNLYFDAPERWKRVVSGPRIRATQPQGMFSTTSAVPLLREILTEARMIARNDPVTARLLFGMAPTVCTTIATLSAADIERIAVEHAPELRPRWEDNAVFWRNLLESAIVNDAGALAKVHVHCIQLLGADLLAARIV